MRLRHNITRAHFPRFLQRSTMARPAESPPPEDTVFYKLFPVRDEREGADEELDLACLAVKCSELAKRLSRDHVWHYQPFELGVCRHVTAGMRGMCLFISLSVSQGPRDFRWVGEICRVGRYSRA